MELIITGIYFLIGFVLFFIFAEFESLDHFNDQVGLVMVISVWPFILIALIGIGIGKTLKFFFSPFYD